MIKNLLVTAALSFCLLSASAQISLSTNDFSQAGDTFRISNATPFTGMDLAGGANHTWDFSQLMMTGQDIDTFVAMPGTTNIYQLVFNNPIFFPANVSNQAERGNSFAIDTNGTFTLSSVFNFYNNKSSGFYQTGFGAMLNGVPIPSAYSAHDMIYKFPMNYNNTDSSIYSYSDSLSGLFYFSAHKKRINNVDGWGTLTTPFGTFPVLRQQSVIQEHDSLKIDSVITFNGGFDRPEVIEYKWLGTGQKIPLLKVVTTGGIPTQIVYRDSARISLIGVPEIPSSAFDFKVYPNPSADDIKVHYSLAKTSDVLFEIRNTEGKIIYSEKLFRQMPGEQKQTINLKYSLSSGNYFLRLAAGEKQEVRKIIISK